MIDEKYEFKIRHKGEGQRDFLEEREKDLWLDGKDSQLTAAKKLGIRDFFLKRDSKCMICGREKYPNNLQIDHKYGNAGNYFFASNLSIYAIFKKVLN